ncbi:unnamed protein product [Pedinophyceae sp. YPF-701]|nr:unnamed protein product [Pedinophyceae sp. YPF-701]
MLLRQARALGSLPERLGSLSGRLGRGFAAQAAPQDDSVEVFIDGKAVHVPKGASVIQACDAAGIDIPRFCYHPKLSIAGNCRMCLVEMEKSPKPVASCAMPVMPGMKVTTNSERVKKAREGVMELLLINHPLDCPICDQGGECDLQDQAMMFGSDRSRFTEVKRGVEDKSLGPLVKTVMTRCIHCTRCVRFSTEIAGVPELGVTGRGKDAEIGTYVDKLLTSEISGNVIDICPVGALTAKPSAFTYRNWELKSTESVDVSDALGSNVRIDSRGTEVIRVVPRPNDAVNEEWISDKARFQYDGLRTQRLTTPFVKGPDGALEPATWADALAVAAGALRGVDPSAVRAIAGRVADTEAMVALKDLVNRLGSSATYTDSNGAGLSADLRCSYVMNSSIEGIDEADAVLLVGTNTRWEAPVLNARLRKGWLNGLRVASVGPHVDLTFPADHFGDSPDELAAMKAGKGPGGAWYKEVFQGAKRPLVIVGAGVHQRADGAAVMRAVADLCAGTNALTPDWVGLNVLQDTAARTAALDVGFVPGPGALDKPAKVVYLLGSDDFTEADVPADAFVIYQGHTGERGAARADVVLPGAAYTEKTATWVNTEGRAQRSKAAVALAGGAREDWKIVRALSEMAGAQLPYDSVSGMRARLQEVAPHLARVDAFEAPLWSPQGWGAGTKDKVDGKRPLASHVENFYQTDIISRTSKTMARCVQARAADEMQATA